MAQQNLDFNIVAHTQGMEAISALINRVGALEAETNKLRTANAALASSTDAVVKNGVRYSNAMDAQSKALKNARQGTQQLGMQINDFATSVSTGASPIQAFNQQIGQVGYAMMQMRGVAGAVGGFLAGPWGALITIGTMAISYLWDVMNQSEKVSKTFQVAMSRAQDALFNYRVETANTREELVSLYETKLAGIELEWKKSSSAVGQYGKQVRLAGEILDEWATKPLYRVVGAIFDKGSAEESYQQARENTANLYSEMMGMQTTLSQLRKRFASEDERASLKEANAAASELKRLQAEAEKLRRDLGIVDDPVDVLNEKIMKLRNMFDSGIVSVDEYRRAIQGLRADLSKETSSPITAVSADALAAPLNIAQQLKTIAEEAGQKIRGFTEEMQNAFDAVGMSVNNAFKGMLTAGMSWKDGMKGIIQSVIDELWRVFVVQQIVGMVSNAIGGAFKAPVQAGGSSAFSAAFAEFAPKAIGGSVGANTPYLVGERGPELFVPRGNGTIIPNKNMGGGSASTINVSVDARGSSDPAAVRAQVQQGILEAAPSIIAAAEQRTIASIRRPRLGGAMQ